MGLCAKCGSELTERELVCPVCLAVVSRGAVSYVQMATGMSPEPATSIGVRMRPLPRNQHASRPPVTFSYRAGHALMLKYGLRKIIINTIFCVLLAGIAIFFVTSGKALGLQHEYLQMVTATHSAATLLDNLHRSTLSSQNLTAQKKALQQPDHHHRNNV